MVKKLFIAFYILKVGIKIFLRSTKALFHYPSRVTFRKLAYLAEVYEIEPKIPEKSLPEILHGANDLNLTLTQSFAQAWQVSIDELVSLCSLLKSAQPAVFFEIGTFDGRTTLNARNNLPEETKVYTIDLPPEVDASRPENKQVGSHIKDHVANGTITQLYGNSLTFDFSPYNKSADFIFIDADHSYESVKSDTENALKMLKPGGTIVWHDYVSIADVTKYVNELAEASPSLGEYVRVKGTSLACLFMK